MLSWIKCSTGSLPPASAQVWCIVKIRDRDWRVGHSVCRRLITVGSFNPESGWWFRNACLEPLPCQSPGASLRRAESCEYWASIDNASQAILDNTNWGDS